jgi:hypothetical protein
MKNVEDDRLQASPFSSLVVQAARLHEGFLYVCTHSLTACRLTRYDFGVAIPK